MLALAPTFDGRRTVPSPEVTRLMMEMLQLTPQDKVLEIGTGSGYQTQQLAKTGAEIHTIELEPFIEPDDVKGCNVYLHSGDGSIGLEQEAPFTAIVATCGVAEIPDAWRKQLVDEGRIVAPIGDSECQRLTSFHKSDGQLIPRYIGGYVRFQMLRHAIHN